MTDADTTSPPPAKKRGGLAAFLAIVCMVMLFAVILINRNAIRSHYWAWQLPRADNLIDQTYYANCLAAVGEDAFGAVRGLAKSDDPTTRVFAIHILDRMPSPAATQIVESLLEDDDEAVRATAAVKLGFKATEKTGGLLKERLIARTCDPRPGPASAAVVALEHVHTLDALAAICDAASEHSASLVQAQAIESIGTWLRSTPEYVAMPAFQASSGTETSPAPAGTLINALADTATFTATLSFEGQMEQIITRSAPQGTPGCIYASAEQRPAVVPGNMPRTVADIAAKTLSMLLGEPIPAQQIASDAEKQALAARVRQSLIDLANQPQIDLPATAPAEPSSEQ